MNTIAPSTIPSAGTRTVTAQRAVPTLKTSSRSALCVLVFFVASLSFFANRSHALEPWQAALKEMPLKSKATSITKTNAVPLLLESFRKNEAAKALVIMPGATDELFFFERVRVWLTNSEPTLLDAVTALTNQSLIEVTFKAPFILVHSAEDPLEPFIKIEDAKTAERIKKKKFQKMFLSNDRDWEGVQPTMEFYADTRISPPANSSKANHFFRHFFVGYDLTAWEALEASSLAGKTIFTVQKRHILFEPDTRFRRRPVVP